MGLITQGCCASVFLANSRYFLNSTIAHDGRVSCTHAFEMKVIKYPLSDFSIAESRLCPKCQTILIPIQLQEHRQNHS
jgi:hypothetical protein